MTPLILDAETLKGISAVVDYAGQHRFTNDDLKRRVALKLPPPGDSPEFVIHVPVGYRCVFTVDQAPPPSSRWFRHISISLPHSPANCAPHIEAVKMLLAAFGYGPDLKKCGVWIEELPHGRKALNVVEPLNPQPT